MPAGFPGFWAGLVLAPHAALFPFSDLPLSARHLLRPLLRFRVTAPARLLSVFLMAALRVLFFSTPGDPAW